MLVHSVECDVCGDSVLGGRAEARESHGWGRRKIDGEMKDVCRTCLAQLSRTPKPRASIN